MITKLLIANRGEIACRVIRTARRMGIATVAVFSDADADALHVTLADEAVWIGPSPARESYLRGERIIEAAQRTGATAIHPGYGFLSENAAFAQQCEDNGLLFIGPPASAIDAMGSKSAAKRIMGDAGVPLIPGYHGEEQTASLLRSEAQAIGYPVLLKAVAGGGGKGMRIADSDAEFETALQAAIRESRASFGDDRMLVEKYLARPRHVEVQVFCDNFGNAVYLAERDCSVQRRHQKVLEEAPAPGVDDTLRSAMGAAAVDAARAIDYRGAGTVEFLLDDDGRFYFMEMNTRLQVEHPVTEMITGQDLVEWQLRVAQGEPLPLAQADIRLSGHAFEARIYAEDPAQDFIPATGRISQLMLPAENAHVRVDTGVRSGDSISPYYDPLIAKLVVWDSSREQALNRLRTALRGFHVAGTVTNLDFLYRLIEVDAFSEGDIDTGFIARHEATIFRHLETDAVGDLASGAVAVLLSRQHERAQAADQHGDPGSPWRLTSGWRTNAPAMHRLTLRYHGSVHSLRVEQREQDFRVITDGEETTVSGALQETRLDITIDGHRRRGTLIRNDAHYSLVFPGHTVEFHEVDDEHAASEEDAGGALSAPMNGTIVTLLVEPGDSVVSGTPLLIMEAMKMEHTVRAPADGILERFLFAPGDLVDGGASLADFLAEDTE
ncbi:acetyl-CoA carboxylase biotin carboxylase subunit [Chromatocurvus halotolerans]|uniref:Biotin carboxylase n=1 Tax=Chromatocurvus halotolerans TaxID=1132028 RepID=A0A4R2KC47_9GAMM|nr:acetyl/propionyl/methylcrotonyl-CoA carboxylase subunit alpha [Chromatocurvus halotolerans]TCO70434.1 3-methylcrotonyl-CoA carboxylase alpha subunit [Chromatocurvus halotolerans]